MKMGTTSAPVLKESMAGPICRWCGMSKKLHYRFGMFLVLISKKTNNFIVPEGTHYVTECF